MHIQRPIYASGPKTCPFMSKIVWCSPKPHFPCKKQRLPGGPIGRAQAYLVPKSILRAPPRAKNYSKTYYSSDIAVQNLLLTPQKPCIPTSMHPSCSKYEIISFSIVKLTIPGGHDTSFASKIRPKTGYGRGPVGVVHAYFVPTPTPWTFSWCKTM